MNVFVVGPEALFQWIVCLIGDTKNQLHNLTPPIDVKVTTDINMSDVLVYEVGQRDDVRARDEHAEKPGLCVVDGASALSLSPQETLLLRGDSECDSAQLRMRFYDAMKAVFMQCHLRAFQRALAGPFSHDVRGALSVVSLSRQLLESGGGGKLVAGKLSRVGSRISMALSDIEARCLCLSGSWPPAPENSKIGAPPVDEIADWFARTQGDRQLRTSSDALREMRAAPAWSTVALTGCIDGVARLSRGAVDVTLTDATSETIPPLNLSEDPTPSAARVFGRGFRITGGDVALSGEQLSCLLQPERWPFVSTHVIPYRLATAALLVQAAGGEVAARQEGAQLEVDICF